MKTVSTKSELENAIRQGEKHFLLKGDLAKQIIKKKQRSKAAKIAGGVLAVGGIIAAIPTGGASLGATAMGLTVGTITISAAELAAIFGGSTLLVSALKGRKIKLHPKDKFGNEVEMEIL